MLVQDGLTVQTRTQNDPSRHRVFRWSLWACRGQNVSGTQREDWLINLQSEFVDYHQWVPRCACPGKTYATFPVNNTYHLHLNNQSMFAEAEREWGLCK